MGMRWQKKKFCWVSCTTVFYPGEGLAWFICKTKILGKYLFCILIYRPYVLTKISVAITVVSNSSTQINWPLDYLYWVWCERDTKIFTNALLYNEYCFLFLFKKWSKPLILRQRKLNSTSFLNKTLIGPTSTQEQPTNQRTFFSTKNEKFLITITGWWLDKKLNGGEKEKAAQRPLIFHMERHFFRRKMTLGGYFS